MARTGLVVVADGLGVPRTAPAALLGEQKVLVGWMPVAPPWLDSVKEGVAVMGGPVLREALASRRLSYLPVRYSTLGRLLTETSRPELAVVSARPAARGFKFGLEVGFGILAANAADRVLVEVDPSLPDVPGAPLVPGRAIDWIDAKEQAPDWSPPAADQADLEIGRLMASLVPPGATVQYGPGSIGDAAVTSLDVSVSIRSGQVTDAVLHLADRGRLVGQVTTAYLAGTRRLRALAEAGDVRLAGIEETHDAARLAALQQFVALNTALQVGLDGSVNVERVAGRQIGGIGGHPDFCAAASASPGGLSVIGVRSSSRGRSTIVPLVHPVTTSRACVDVVVTEHGIADLRGLDDERRARALIGVADPAFREELLRSLAGASPTTHRPRDP